MIPRKARPVVEEIRRLVPKPDELPVPEAFGARQLYNCLGWNREDDGGVQEHRCPLGFLPYALTGRPGVAEEFDDDCPFSVDQAEEFWIWWDVQSDAERAVAEVWDEELVT